MQIISVHYTDGIAPYKYAVEDDKLEEELATWTEAARAVRLSPEAARKFEKVTHEDAGKYAFIPCLQGEQHGGTVYFKISGWKRLLEISIYVDAPYKKGRKVAGYTVNWSALGSQSPMDALEYATALIEACSIGARLSATYRGKPLQMG